jgi:hypothetical protein
MFAPGRMFLVAGAGDAFTRAVKRTVDLTASSVALTQKRAGAAKVTVGDVQH